MALDKITPEEGNRLVRQEPNELVQSSAKSFERDTVIAHWMDLICQATSTEITSAELGRYWFEGLKAFPVEAINYAFDYYMKFGCDEHGRFFRPAPAQIVKLCGEWQESQATKSSGAVEAMDELKIRAAGGEEFFGMADVAAEFKQVLKDKGIL